jgi:hypothetical protein
MASTFPPLPVQHFPVMLPSICTEWSVFRSRLQPYPAMSAYPRCKTGAPSRRSGFFLEDQERFKKGELPHPGMP